MSFDLATFWDRQFEEHKALTLQTQGALIAPFAELLERCAASIRAGGKILFFGNGGSAADAQHLATELAARYIRDRAAIAAIALTTDTSLLTAIGNDTGFDQVFARQIEAIGKKGDVAIGISTSGKSPNVLRALEKAKGAGIYAVGLTGATGGQLPDICDLVLKVPSQTTARIQEMHIMLGQMLCGALELKLGLVD